MRALDEFYEKNFPEFVALRTKVSKFWNNANKENKTVKLGLQQCAWHFSGQGKSK